MTETTELILLRELRDLWAKELNRRVDVENVLFEAAAGKRPLPDADECRALAVKLGVSPALVAERKKR